MPEVSIIIPTYNRENSILKALNSALAQTYQNYEVIIVDDGSTDSTKELIYDYLSKNPNDKVHYIYKENERLPSISRNHGSFQAKGKYLAFLDSDDLWHPQKLELQMKVFKENSKTILCYTQGASQLNGEEILASGWFPKKSGSVFLPLCLRNFIITSSVVIKSNVFKELNGFPTSEKFIIGEDLDLWLRASKRGHCHFLNSNLVFYTINDQNISGDVLRRFKCLKEVLQKNLEHFHYSRITKSIVYLFLEFRKFLKIKDHPHLVQETIRMLKEENKTIRYSAYSTYYKLIWKTK